LLSFYVIFLLEVVLTLIAMPSITSLSCKKKIVDKGSSRSWEAKM